MPFVRKVRKKASSPSFAVFNLAVMLAAKVAFMFRNMVFWFFDVAKVANLYLFFHCFFLPLSSDQDADGNRRPGLSEKLMLKHFSATVLHALVVIDFSLKPLAD